MMFAQVRLSDLKKEAQLKRDRLDQSAAAFKMSLREFRNPLTLAKKHPLMLLAGVGSAFAAVATSFNLFKKRNFLRNIAALGGTAVLRMVFPLATQVGLSLLNSLNKKKKD